MGIGVVLPRVITPNLKPTVGVNSATGGGSSVTVDRGSDPFQQGPGGAFVRAPGGTGYKDYYGNNRGGNADGSKLDPNAVSATDKQAIDNFVNLRDAQWAMLDANNAERLANANAMARAQYAASGADNSGQRERNALSIWGNELDRQQVEKLWGLNQQKFAADNTYYGDLLKRTGEQYGMNEATRNNANMAVSNQWAKDARATKSDATARGATTSAGVKSAYSDLAAQAKVGYTANSITFDKAKNAIDDQMALYRKRQEDLGFTHMTDEQLMLKALDDNALNRKTLDSLGRSIGVGSGQSAALLAATITANNLSFANADIQRQIERSGAVYGQGVDTYGLPKTSAPPDVTKFSPLRQPTRTKR